MEKSRIQALVDYFEACPIIKGQPVGVDQIGGTVQMFSISPYLTSNNLVKRYTDGMEIRQYPFYLQSTEKYSMDQQDTIANNELYEKLSAWIIKKNRAHELPDFQGVQSIEILSDGYLVDASTDIAIYQIQARVIYLEDTTERS